MRKGEQRCQKSLRPEGDALSPPLLCDAASRACPLPRSSSLMFLPELCVLIHASVCGVQAAFGEACGFLSAAGTNGALGQDVNRTGWLEVTEGER